MCLTKLDQGARQRRAPEDHIVRANAVIQEDRGITVYEVVEMLDINVKPAIATEEKYCWRKLFCCTTTVLIPMQQPQQDRQIETSSSRFCHIHLTASTSHRVTFMPLIHYVVTGLVAKRCVHGFGNKLKRASPKELGRLWADTKGVCNCSQPALKNCNSVT